MTISSRSRYRGTLLGLAAGDALGATTEFEERGTFEPVKDIVGGGIHKLKAGEWTDDTSMAMCLAESLLEMKGFDAKDQMTRYLRWWREGYWSATGKCFDIGGTVNSALARFERSGEPFSGQTDPNTAGNGSLMRLAPVALYFAADRDKAIEMAAESSRTTHATAEAVDACRYFAALLLDALNGATKEALLHGHHGGLPGGELAPRVAAVAAGSYRSKRAPRGDENFDETKHVNNTGYVIHTLEAALWAFDEFDSFRDGCIAAANLGGDADTIAAVYGQLAGAFWGEEAIPAEWRKKLVRHDDIVAIADRLHDAAVADR